MLAGSRPDAGPTWWPGVRLFIAISVNDNAACVYAAKAKQKEASFSARDSVLFKSRNEMTFGQFSTCAALLPSCMDDVFDWMRNQYIAHHDLLHDVWEDDEWNKSTIRSVIRHSRVHLREGGMADLADAIQCHNGHYVLIF